MSHPRQPYSPATGAHVRYSEHLAAPRWVWIVTLVVAFAIGFSYYVALGLAAGILAFAVVAAFVVWLLRRTAPTIKVTDTELQVGRAHIPLVDLGTVGTLDRTGLTQVRGTHADPRAYAVVRTLTASGAVVAQVTDAADPHSYWLVSSRHPQRFAEILSDAVSAERASARPGSYDDSKLPREAMGEDRGSV